MELNEKAIEELRIIINGDNTEGYRSGPKLVSFFNALGFNDKYGQGFPSRWIYTEDNLKIINETPQMVQCIQKTFAVVDYVGRIAQLDRLIADFNQYIAFDKWAVVRDNDTITLKRLDKIVIDSTQSDTGEIKEDEFLKLAFNVDIDSLGLEPNVSEIIKLRLKEVENCISKDAPLASILLIGSIMEAILLGIASIYPQKYNQAPSAPKDKDDKVRKFQDWTLSYFIDVSCEIGLLNQDVKKFSHVIRDFRNYIHPYQQIVSEFFPDKQTALICLQVLKAAIYQIGNFRQNKQRGN